MATGNSQLIVHPSQGGFLSQGDGGIFAGLYSAYDPTMLPPGHLVTADNIFYKDASNRWKKRPGTMQFNTTSSGASAGTGFLVSSSSNVRAVADFWSLTSNNAPSGNQNIVVVAGASIFVSTGDGRFTPVSVSSSFGANSNTTTNITIAQNYAVISGGTGVQPVAYDQTTLVTPSTGANWPQFEASVFHLARLWFFGQSTGLSNLQYTAASNIFDSTGTDSGFLPVSPGDGDRIIGMSQPFYQNSGVPVTYVFKGPNKGSVWQLSGAIPSQFSIQQVASGSPVLNHKCIVTTDKRIYWLSRYGVHALKTVQDFGNVNQFDISLPIQDLWRSGLNIGALSNAIGVWYRTLNSVGWHVTPAGGSQSWMLLYNYALSDDAPDGKKFWSIWKFNGFNVTASTVVVSPSGTRAGEIHLFLGTDNGFVLQGDQTTLNDFDGTVPYTAQVTIPILVKLNGSPRPAGETFEKQFVKVETYFTPVGAYTGNISISVDSQQQQSTTFSLSGGGATLT